MCRLLAAVHAGSNLSLDQALGSRALEKFQGLARVHRDGWGAVWRSGSSLSSYHTGTPTDHDSVLFRALTGQPLGAVLIHQRWASPGLGLTLDFQQPFTGAGLAFAHNGTIANAEGNLAHRSAADLETLGLPGTSPEARSDSRLYADLFRVHLGRLGVGPRTPSPAEVVAALTQTVAQLRRPYPEASFNVLVQTADHSFALEAHAAEPQASETLHRRYREAGWADQIASYYELRHTALRHSDGSVTRVAASSGWATTEAWDRLGNNRILVMSHRDGGAETVELGD